MAIQHDIYLYSLQDLTVAAVKISTVTLDFRINMNDALYLNETGKLYDVNLTAISNLDTNVIRCFVSLRDDQPDDDSFIITPNGFLQIKK